jgi:FkbM family methyltransferase
MRRTFNFMTKKSMNIFVRGNDIGAVRPQIFGIHEERLTKFIEVSAQDGNSDFFIDIGANVGLSSSQNGNSFNKVICFEPNPLAANILKTNLSISMPDSSFEVCEFALGETDGSFDLYIPKHNWGGAFIKEDNQYSDELLYKKDGFDGFDLNNYTVKSVEVKASENVFSNMFTSLIDDNLKKGVIKIDAEGYEELIISSIAKTLPASLEVVIVFENWNQKFDFNKIRNHFPGRDIVFKKLVRSIVGTQKSTIRKAIEFAFLGETTYIDVLNEEGSVVGDIIIDANHGA